MVLRSRILFAALLSLAWLLPAGAAHSAARDRKELLLNGRAVDGSGKPLAGARITASGDVVITLVADSDGRFTLRVPAGTVGEVTRHPLRFAVEARAGSRRLRVSSGAPRLEIALGGATGPDSERMDAESNVPEVAEHLTRALGEPGDGVAPADITFTSGRAEATRPAAPVAARPATGTPSAPSVAPAPPRAASGSPAPARAPAGSPPRASAPAAPPAAHHAPAERRANREPTALEVLESARRHGTILAAESSSVAPGVSREESKARTAAAREQQRLYRRERELIEAAARAAESRRRESERDRLREVERSEIATREARRVDEAARAAVRRDNEIATIRQRDSLAIARRDSAIAALRQRDSLATLQRALGQIAREERQDSLRATRTPPRLDSRPPVAGRPASVDSAAPRVTPDSCTCKVEGTIEVRSTRPLTAPFGVTVAIRGRPALRDRVRLFMGAPREFSIPRVPCGRWELDVTPEPGKHFVIEPASRPGPFDCAAASLHQLRIVLVPR